MHCGPNTLIIHVADTHPSSPHHLAILVNTGNTLTPALYTTYWILLSVLPGARFSTKLALEDAIGSHACSLEANRRVTNDIHLGCPLFLPVHTVNYVQTLKARENVRSSLATHGIPTRHDLSQEFYSLY
jgi:hypothetical protein